MSYNTIYGEAIGEYEEKKSLFIGHIKRVTSEEEARGYINSVREAHREARHNIYAYVIGEGAGIQRYSDDGEPQGTAGIPALEVIKKNELKDVVLVITRYFGGILLGAAGLTRAYGKAASEAVRNSEKVEIVRGFILNIEINYDLLGKVQYYLGNENLIPVDIKYEDKVSIKLYIEETRSEGFQKDLINITSNNILINIEDEGSFFKRENNLSLIS